MEDEYPEDKGRDLLSREVKGEEVCEKELPCTPSRHLLEFEKVPA